MKIRLLFVHFIPMNRSEFFSKFGIFSGVALVSSCLESCQHELAREIYPIDFTINLEDPKYLNLKTPSSFAFVNEIIVAYTIHKTYIALAARCTHQGSLIAYYDSDIIFCSKHGASFNTNGEVINGPATQNLLVYKTLLTNSDLRIHS